MGHPESRKLLAVQLVNDGWRTGPAGDPIRKDKRQARSSGSAIGTPDDIHLRLRQLNPDAIVGLGVGSKAFLGHHSKNSQPRYGAIVRVVNTHKVDYSQCDHLSNRPVSGGFTGFALNRDSNRQTLPALSPLTLWAARDSVSTQRVVTFTATRNSIYRE